MSRIRSRLRKLQRAIAETRSFRTLPLGMEVELEKAEKYLEKSPDPKLVKLISYVMSLFRQCVTISILTPQFELVKIDGTVRSLIFDLDKSPKHIYLCMGSEARVVTRSWGLVYYKTQDYETKLVIKLNSFLGIQGETLAFKGGHLIQINKEI